MTHLYFIRHGDYIEDLENGSYQDLGLSPKGIRQTECLRDRLASTGEIKADVLIASPMKRAKASAELLAPALGLPIVFEKDLEEWVCDDGTLTPSEFSARWNQVPDTHKPFFRFMAGYETGLEFSGRVQAALHRLLQEYSGKTLVLVTHGGVIAASFHYFFGLSGAVPARVTPSAMQTSITHWFRPSQGQTWVLERFNDTHHLERLG
ncbi:phosphoglycerate mutase [Ktedonobacter sp. SOSP1-52]|uniref:histidine phosphatase family protein n=1 Tax=Ktedonobacter sp. SOSP1-52 TaxID=2778366 RepID=UPI001915E589|nr:histidine phosphatase family protein [Ktedonobacter sp. SOSP1-52]GHO63648.1 phosphoglycerate mutase [Ktedonobacter sp. SOSP1-52]